MPNFRNFEFFLLVLVSPCSTSDCLFLLIVVLCCFFTFKTRFSMYFPLLVNKVRFCKTIAAVAFIDT